MKAFEVNFDGLVGPTHNYSGLSFGNIASMNHSQQVSNPKAAAKEGLEKMLTLSLLGIKQAVLPPQPRPYLPLLHRLGYRDLKEAENDVVKACSSSAYMWAANAATISPSMDSFDKKVHITPANLINKLHRFIEPPMTAQILKSIFSDPHYFTHHDPLPGHEDFSDEGAANHTRFCKQHGSKGIHLYVYGKSENIKPKKFPARQTLRASQAISRLHQQDLDDVIFAQQNPDAIDLGVFHNDVISVGNENVFFLHELAYVDTPKVLEAIRSKMEMIFIVVKESEIPIKEAIRTYLFNSQIVTLPTGNMALVAPTECYDSKIVYPYLMQLLDRTDLPIKEIVFQPVRQSMQNGGGPACLRLRVVLTENEFQHMHQGVILTEELYKKLDQWIEKHYRDRLTPNDLADTLLLDESNRALEALSQILHL